MIPSLTAIFETAILEHPDWDAYTMQTVTMTVSSAAATNKIYAATSPFVTMGVDTPAEQHFAGTLIRDFTFSRTIVGGNGFGGLSTSLGDVRMSNIEADYDEIDLAYAVDGGRVVIKVGEVGADGRADYASFYTVADLIASRKEANEQQLTVKMIDKSFMLDVPAQPNVYLGTGNLEGGSELAGKRKPLGWGWITHATPAPVIPAEGVDQVSDGAVEDITACYDTGVPLTFTSDYATSLLLRAATLVPGQWASCNAEGLGRRGGAAFGPVAYDFQGRNVGGFAETTAAIIKAQVLLATELEADEIADNTFDVLDMQQPAPIGYFLPHTSEETVSEVVTKLATGIVGYAGFSLRFALFEVGLFAEPSILSTAEYDEQKVLRIAREALPDGINPPPYRQRVTYARNWTVLDTVAAEVSDADRVAYLKSPYQIAVTSEADGEAILQDHALAKDPPPLESYFRDEADAQALADSLLSLFAGSPVMYRATIHSHPFVHDIGETIKLTKPRFDLTDGKNVVLVAIEDRVGTSDGDVQDVTGFA